MARDYPVWLKKRLPAAAAAQDTAALLERLALHTVCESAHCPNLGECYAAGTATFMILGDVCTRRCSFCAVPKGVPAPPDPDEPRRLAQAAAALGLRHVVITSVTRDDLADGGAGHFAATVRAVHDLVPAATVEVLTPDFQGQLAALATVVEAGPEVFNHNVETVPRLYPVVRPRASYQRSLEVLRLAKQMDARLYTKSGLMVGLGETPEEVRQVMADLRAVGCDVLTVGQYLAPTDRHYPVREFIWPATFDLYAAWAREMGFKAVACGPFVRSSYGAAQLFWRIGEEGRHA